MTAEFAKEENKITSQFDSDPLLKLKSREVDLRAMENERKAKEAEERINLDKARTMMDQEFKEEKLEQNEKLAKLRAGVSLAKSGAGNTEKKVKKVMREFKKGKLNIGGSKVS